MTGKDLIQRIGAHSSDALFQMLYGADRVDAARSRYLGLAEATLRDFPEAATDLRVFTAAGRTELGGNHTDHNHGKVMAASIQLDAVAFVTPRTDSTVLFRSTGYSDVLVDISSLEPRKEEIGTTEALVRGIAAEFKARGTMVGGFTANAASTVLPGSGLSSSAAVEVLFGVIFDGLYGQGKRSPVEIAQIGQKAENLYFGKPCGLMDQVASASGGAVAIDFADTKSPMVKQVNFDPASAGYALCVADTGGNHADLTSDYAAVPEEMKAVARFFGKTVLRELNRSDILSRGAELRKSVGDRAFLRALHFLAENERVDSMLAALKEMDHAGTDAASVDERNTAVASFLDTVEESGDSSWELLQNVFAPKNPEEQGVSLALALTREFLKLKDEGVPVARGPHKGVCRVHGGGFAGTIQAYIPIKRLEDYIRWMSPVFGPRSVTVLRIRPFGAGELQFP